MSKKFKKSIEILEKRIRILKARLSGMTERDSAYHETREECSAMERILTAVNCVDELKEACESARYLIEELLAPLEEIQGKTTLKNGMTLRLLKSALTKANQEK